MLAALSPAFGGSRHGGALSRLSQLIALRRQRRLLAEMPAERLRDIGLNVADVRQEDERPTWDVPVHWLR